MSRQDVQKAVIAQLRSSEHPLRVGDLIEAIRREKPEFANVRDYDFRTAVLALTANGQIHSTSTNRVEARVETVGARG
jgi:hypothetical protein